eukprot:CAMPEP_0197693110 /NCGR_PEP_ID=MMETSP1338-20131121/112019_1 /TAXON_ID=43686 ORGANISM="Pelagodinium beii, Strain RCC1491" /NCGR_SAMPLE_ID=MMETSP1338 /ASSEMBLY_ACC=CAM_ASM_000754 /LENGTH=124 /DNA_ID=CAMNT_0043275823 /DNA_START=233 /DNA_END=603 /DNA_ORIENTATION=+
MAVGFYALLLPFTPDDINSGLHLMVGAGSICGFIGALWFNTGKKDARPVSNFSTSVIGYPVNGIFQETPLEELASSLRRDLHLSGEVEEVVAVACARLDIPTEGLSLREQAERCCSALPDQSFA